MGKRIKTPKTRFEYKDAKSHKFWQIQSRDELINIRYGKVGTDGQLTSKEAKSTDAAIASTRRRQYPSNCNRQIWACWANTFAP